MISPNTWNIDQEPLRFQRYADEPSSGGGGVVNPPQPSVPDTPKPTIDEIKEKIRKGDIKSALEDLKLLGATNVRESDEKDSNGKVIGKTIEFTYSGKEYSVTYFSPQGNSGNNSGSGNNGNNNSGNGQSNTRILKDPHIFRINEVAVIDPTLIDPGCIIKPDKPDVPEDPIGTEEPPIEPEEPLDDITKVMDLNNIPGYADDETKTYNAKSYNKNSYVKKAKKDAKNLLSQYKETFKSYACGLLGNSFDSKYSAFFDRILNSFIENYELNIKTTATGGYTISYKTKDLVDGFLTKLDEAIKAKMQ